MRDWWMEAANWQCQAEFFDENGAFVECQNGADHVHHILPEGYQLAHGLDPEHSPGLPLCKYHHVSWAGDLEPIEWSEEFSFHPEMGLAHERYRDWKQRALHQKSMGLKPEPSPYEDMVQLHREQTAEGQQYWAGGWEVMEYYTQKMEEKALRYELFHPENPHPISKPHAYYDPEKQTHWYDEYFHGKEQG